MKLLPILLLNVVTAGGAVVIYDQVRAGSRPAADEMEVGGGDYVPTDHEERIAALEDERAPVLSAPPPVPGPSKAEVARMIRAEIGRLGADGVAPVDSEGEPAVFEEPLPIVDVERMAIDPNDIQLQAFEKMMDKVDAKRRQEREAVRRQRLEERLARNLDRLDIGLDESQKREILDARRELDAKRRELFQKRRDGDLDGGSMREVLAPLSESFQATINKIVPDPEAAQKVIRSVNAGAGRGGMLGLGGRGGGRGRGD